MVLRVIDVPKDGLARVGDLEAVGPPPEGTLRWIDITGPTPELLERIRVPFRLHPLAIEDCLTFEQRPKLEEYPDHLFVVIHELSIKNDAIESVEVHSFIGASFLITVRVESCQSPELAYRRVLDDPALHLHGIGYLYYLVADAVANKNSGVLDDLSEAIDALEEQIVESNGAAAPTRVFELKRSVSSARRALSPQRDIFAALSRLESRFIREGAGLYLRDIYDKLVRSAETLEMNRELLSNLLDAHFSLVSQRTNEIMKRLTALSAIFLPVTFITGFFGQNFASLPFDAGWLFYAGLASLALIPAAMLSWFRRKKWI